MDTRNNTLARYKLLEKALQGGKKIPAALLKACLSQGGLAKLSMPSEGIEPMSLNTLKTKASEVIEEGGWEKLDEMRVAYLNADRPAAIAATKDKPSQAEGLKSKLQELEGALEAERRYRIRLQVAYDSLLTRMRSVAKIDPDLTHFINRHVTGFSFKRLSILSSPENDVGK
jgi:hypothetical protein